ncbi:MAG TPA: hypothetical protein VHZ78_00690 [Rhizomicrobium sp.]|jgi:hypothetical protein|nr:hypothetical protein [Rhizomicrobium sp.]
MNLGPVIDVAIGLIFVYLLLGLIGSALQELVASALTWRGKLLVDAVTKLVANGDAAAPFLQKLLGHGLMSGLTADRAASYLPSKTFSLALIDTLSAGSTAPVFSAVQNGISGLPPGGTRDSLLAFVKDSGGDLDKFKASLANWYDDAMDRVSGIYKRKSQIFALVFGLAIAIVLNVDSVRLGNKLWTDDALRSNVVAAAQAYTATCPDAACQKPQTPQKPPAPAASAPAAPAPAAPAPTAPAPTAPAPTAPAPAAPAPAAPAPAANTASDPTADINKARESINSSIGKLTDLKLPIGWPVFNKDVDDAMALALKNHVVAPGKITIPDMSKTNPVVAFFQMVGNYWMEFGVSGFLLVALGWIITGIATSLGAPFWFDMLKNILSLRGAGPKPARADGTGSNT